MAFSALITGCNRGIGLELVRQLAERGWRLHACCRRPDEAGELQELSARYSGLITIHALDVCDAASIAALRADIGNQPIDLLLNNAGVYGPYDANFGNTDETQWLQTLRVNTIAPMKMMEAFADNVAASTLRLIASMSSKMGSMDDNGSGGSYIYRSSKAALNAVMKSASLDLADRGITAVILHPGWVKTDMGGPNAQISTEICVSQLLVILDQVQPSDAGTFYDIDGTVIPW